MRKFKLLLISMILSSSALFCQWPSQISGADEIWEKVIAAKGGREQLLKISNCLVVYRQTKGKRLPIHVELYIFPERHWLWSNQGGVLGTNIWVRDSMGTWRASDDGSGRGVTWHPPSETDQDALRTQALFLMETKWFRPKILGLTQEQLGREEFDVVTVDAGRDHVKYYVDKKTSLVRRVSPVRRFGNVVSIAVDLINYKLVQGIMMPSRYKSREGGTYDLEFAFDVEYDPGIFKRKPSIEDGPEGWKPAKK